MTITDVDWDAAYELPTTAAPRRALPTWVAPTAKRTLDVVVALLVLLLALPVLLVVAVAVKLDGGPALFRQRRIGRGGEGFAILKFRSMAVDAEERLRRDPELYRRYVENDHKLPSDEDPRITRLGRFLRASSLDELPQLLNVLRGDMSLVGPRPIVAAELEEYRVRGGERAYKAVRPGMTGQWQASGRSLVGYDERVRMDVAYVRTAGFRTDLSIMVRTVGAVIRAHGAH